jgi:hypothetical protein
MLQILNFFHFVISFFALTPMGQGPVIVGTPLIYGGSGKP